VVAALVVVSLFETWCLWRVIEQFSVLGGVEDRLTRVAHSLALLTDTTETCFQVVASQLECGTAARAAPPNGRAARQRRVVGAARRGRSINEIAAAEEVAESEVRLRLHLAEQDAHGGEERHGSMRT
jgi:hypothetical protein